MTNSPLGWQEEKEALDDLSTELELADEDEAVLYVFSYLPDVVYTGDIYPDTKSAKLFFTCHYLALWKD